MGKTNKKILSFNANPWTESSEEMVNRLKSTLTIAQQLAKPLYGVKKRIYSVGIKNEYSKVIWIQSAEWVNPEIKISQLKQDLKISNEDKVKVHLTQAEKNLLDTKKQVKQLEDQLKINPENKHLQEDLIKQQGKLYGQPCRPGDIIKCNFVYDIETKKASLLIYVNDSTTFYKKNTPVVGHPNVYQSIDTTIRNISLPEKDKQYALPWDKNNKLSAHPDTHILVTYPGLNGEECYPIANKEAVVSTILSSSQDDLLSYLNLDIKNKVDENIIKEITTTTKEAIHIKLIIEKQLQNNDVIILNHKEITNTFNELENNYLKALSISTSKDLLLPEESPLKSEQEENKIEEQSEIEVNYFTQIM